MSAGGVGSDALEGPDEGLSVEVGLGSVVDESDESLGGGLGGGDDADGDVALPDDTGNGLGVRAGGAGAAVLPGIPIIGRPVPTRAGGQAVEPRPGSVGLFGPGARFGPCPVVAIAGPTGAPAGLEPIRFGPSSQVPSPLANAA